MAIAQNSAHGVVISEDDGSPVVGAYVVVNGDNTNGTMTDAEGRFSLRNIPSLAKTLHVSCVGMKDIDVPIASGEMRVIMQTDKQFLDEVMVVAFGTQKRSSFTGSAAVVDSKELSKHVTTNVTNALVGSTPGLQIRGASGAPGAGAGSINIRGVSSLYAGTAPLVIVDGAPYSASLSNIPQEDIESITVLKDAASAALYGARGASGVIIVTTKAGKTSEAQVTFNGRWGFNSRSVQDYNTVDDPARYYEQIYSQYYNNYYYNQGLSQADANVSANKSMLNALGYNIYAVPDGQQLIGTDGKINPNATKGRSYTANGRTYYLTNDDWTKEAYSNSLRQEYTVGISGGFERGSIYASLGYLNDDGIIEYSGYKRLNARLKADYQAKDWLRFNANVSYTNSKTTANANMDTSLGAGNVMYYTSHIGPIYPVFVRVLDENGKPTILKDSYGHEMYDYGVSAQNYPGCTRAFLSTGNPLGANRYNDVWTKLNKLNGNFGVDIKLTDFLKFNATSTLGYTGGSYSHFESMFEGAKVSVNGTIDKEQYNTIFQNHVQTLTYFDTFGKHSVNVLVGHEWYDTKTSDLSANAQGMFSPDIQEINAASKPVDSDSYASEYNVEGYFISAQYNFAEKYFASASYRRDASSRFLKDNRWGDFWSVGGAWLLGSEKFFNAGWVDELKLKASIGQQGNDNINSYAYVDTYSLTSASDTKMSASFRMIGNPDITWETTTNFNAGVEFSFFKSRLTGGLDFYNKKTSDLLFWLSVPESAGSRGYYGNVGDIRNYGLELNLQGSLIRTKDMNWSVNFNIAHNRDKILKLPDQKIADYGGFTEGGRWFREGGHVYNYLIAEYAGVNEKGEALYWCDSNPDLLDASGNMASNRPGKNHDYTTTDFSKATYYEQGSSMPDVFGGFGTSFTWRGFDLSATFDYQIGGHIYDTNYAVLMRNIETATNAGGAIHKDILKSWTVNNNESSIPRSFYGDQYTAARSDRWLTNASYLNFQSFTIGYSFPKMLIKKIKMSNLRVYVAGENLYFWSARKGLDPRYSYAANEYTSVYSPVRTIMGGVQITF